MSLATRNIEPIAGYVLRERIGSGGYGEVWKADAPGGLAKAIKLVYGYSDGDRASRELKAMGLVKTLRHPFLLSLERIEIVEGQLIIVTELADCSLKDRFESRRAEGLRGIPRPELLQFMRDAADALDYMNEQHSLQHLDVKPENLLLVGDHVKVADFGLVKDIQKQTASMLGGLTPVYASPELFSGTATRRSDQYSLAIVYQEMLTGVLPFPGKTAAQLAAQHLNAKPLLFSLPPGERKVIARALAKSSDQRFANCRELVEHLQNEALQSALPSAESWFGKGGASREEEEPVRSTMCLNTSRLSIPAQSAAPIPEHNAPQAQSAHAEPYIASDDSARSTHEMLADAEEASDRVAAEFSPTFVMRRSREPKIEQVDAPLVASSQVLRPTVIIGIGQVAALVMQRMKQRLVDRLGGPIACPSVQFLFLDADPQTTQRAARGDDGAALDSQEVMLLGLRKSQEYRSEGPALLQWLSRRWLYNIPRSQMPEGLRPLGRLALADHARPVRERVRKAIQKSQSEESLDASQQITGIPFGGEPRVIVLGAISGGTAGGMMLDVCFLARQLLERLGNPDRDVTSLMLHYRGRQSAAHDLAVVNAYAALAELDYYSRSEKHYPGDPSCGLEPRKEDHAPVRDGYFLHLGDFLGDAELAAAADRTAEYLYLNCFAAASGFFDACRKTTPSQSERGLTLRSFGLTQVGFSSGELIPWATMSLCHDLLNRWLGEGQRGRGDVETTAEQEAQEFIKSRELELEPLLQTMLTELGRALGERPDTIFRAALLPDGQPLTAAALPQLDFNVVLHRLNGVLAQRSEEALGPEAKYPVAIQSLSALVGTMARQQASVLGQWALNGSAVPGLRVCRSEKAAACITRHLSSLHDQVRLQRRQLQDGLSRLEQLLGIGDPMVAGRLPPLRKSPQEYEAKFLEYCQLRMFNVGLFFVQELARRIKNASVPTNDLLIDARRDIKGLIADLQPPNLSESEGSELDQQLRQALLDEFATHRTALVQGLDISSQEKLFPHAGGFLAAITRGGEHRSQLTSQLFQAARNALLRSLQGLDVANFLLQSGDPNQPTARRLRDSLAAAQPKLLADGACRTLMAVSQSCDDSDRQQALAAAVEVHTKAKPAVISYPENDVTIVCEVSGLSIAEVATRLIDDRPDFIEYAKRVFSRSDIPFEPLAVKDEDES